MVQVRILAAEHSSTVGMIVGTGWGSVMTGRRAASRDHALVPGGWLYASVGTAGSY